MQVIWIDTPVLDWSVIVVSPVVLVVILVPASTLTFSPSLPGGFFAFFSASTPASPIRAAEFVAMAAMSATRIVYDMISSVGIAAPCAPSITANLPARQSASASRAYGPSAHRRDGEFRCPTGLLCAARIHCASLARGRPRDRL